LRLKLKLKDIFVSGGCAARVTLKFTRVCGFNGINGKHHRDNDDKRQYSLTSHNTTTTTTRPVTG
jgi:hypothetical protein